MKKVLILSIAIMLLMTGFSYAAKKTDLEKILDALAEIKTYSADFQQINEIEGFGEDTYSGHVFIRNKHKALWVYNSPNYQFYLFNKKEFVHYDDGLEQMTKRKLGSDEQVDVMKQLMVDFASLNRNFNLVLDGDIINMTPKKNIGFKSLAIKIKADKNFKHVVVSELHSEDNGGTKTKIIFNKQELNKTIKDSIFEPDVPKDTHVIEM